MLRIFTILYVKLKTPNIYNLYILSKYIYIQKSI